MGNTSMRSIRRMITLSQAPPTVDTDRVAALEILLHGLLADKGKLFHAFLHLVHTTTQENQQGFDLLGCGPQLQHTPLGDVQGLLNLLNAVGIFSIK